jgi:hypothetical protein
MEARGVSQPKPGSAVSSIFLVPHWLDRIREGHRLAADLIADDLENRQRVLRGVHPDLLVLEPLPGKEKIGIDQVRDVIREAHLSPVRGRQRVCLVSRAEAMTPEAANALLKVLEEPPPGLMFLFLAEHTTDILPTILSRSQIVRRMLHSRVDHREKLAATGYTEKEQRYLLAIARREKEIERFKTAKADLATLCARTREQVQRASVETLVTTATSDDPILRSEGVLSLFARLVAGEGELAVSAAKGFARAGENVVRAWLEDALYLIFYLFRATLFASFPPWGDTLVVFSTKVTIRSLLELLLMIERTYRAVEGFAALEASLLLLFLGVSGSRNG